MGAGQSSTRRLSIPNEDRTSGVNVSDSVVQRLEGEAASSVEQEPRNDIRIRPNQPSRPTQQHLESSRPSAPSDGIQTSLQPQQQCHEPSLKLIQLLWDKETELHQNDKYWRQRLAKLQEDHAGSEVNKILEEECNKASREVPMRFVSVSTEVMNPSCQDLKASVLECYKNNPKNTLACSKIVHSFASCVNSSRVNVVENGG